MAEDMPEQDAYSAGTADPTPDDLPDLESSIDMSGFEAMLFQGEGPARERVGAVPGFRRQPIVEWAIAWADGRVTKVNGEAAARLVADRFPACQVACRIVGTWGPA